MFTALLFIMTKNNSNIHKQVRRETVDYSYNGLLFTSLKKNNELLTPTIEWTNRINIMLSKRS